jgi:hypothetical protein
MPTLAREIAAFERLRPDLVAEFEGRWAVVFGDDLIGVRDDWESALKLGYEARGLEPFLVKEILTVDRVHYFSRPL